MGGHAENQLCAVGMSGQEQLSCCSTEESEMVELEEGMLCEIEICEVADKRFGMTLGAAGSGSPRPKPASAVSASSSASTSLRMSSTCTTP